MDGLFGNSIQTSLGFLQIRSMTYLVLPADHAFQNERFSIKPPLSLDSNPVSWPSGNRIIRTVKIALYYELSDSLKTAKGLLKSQKLDKVWERF